MSFSKVIEKTVRRFTRRIGDWVAEGSNNTLIVLGVERVDPDKAASVENADDPTSSGAIYMVVGRKDLGGNPSISDDDATFYLSMKSDPDKNLKLQGKGPQASGVSSAVLKCDAVRFVARDSFKIAIDKSDTHVSVTDKNITIESGSTIVEIVDGKVSIKSSEVSVQASNVSIKGNVDVKGMLTSNGVNLSTHTHQVPGITAGPAVTNTVPPTPSP